MHEFRNSVKKKKKSVLSYIVYNGLRLFLTDSCDDVRTLESKTLNRFQIAVVIMTSQLRKPPPSSTFPDIFSSYILSLSKSLDRIIFRPSCSPIFGFPPNILPCLNRRSNSAPTTPIVRRALLGC